MLAAVPTAQRPKKLIVTCAANVTSTPRVIQRNMPMLSGLTAAPAPVLAIDLRDSVLHRISPLPRVPIDMGEAPILIVLRCL